MIKFGTESFCYSWFNNHSGPESSGSQEEGANEKSGGTASPNEDGSTHFTDWDDQGNRASWDEDSEGHVSGHHVTPSEK